MVQLQLPFPDDTPPIPDELLTVDDPQDVRQVGRITDLIAGYTKQDKFWDLIANCFQQMQIAEDEIAKGMRAVWAEDETAAARIWGCFKTCRTKFPLNDILFRAHCREIVERARDNRLEHKKDREPATDAELLYVMLQTSLATPLNEQGSRLYWELFRAALPEAYAKIGRNMSKHGLSDPSWLPREQFAGATVQLLADLKHKYRWERDEGYTRLPSNPDCLAAILKGE